MIISEKRAKEGERLPRFYGLAWYDFARNEKVCYPVPFHLIFRWISHLWQKITFTYITDFEKQLLVAELKGFERGQEFHKKLLADRFEREFGRPLFDESKEY